MYLFFSHPIYLRASFLLPVHIRSGVQGSWIIVQGYTRNACCDLRKRRVQSYQAQNGQPRDRSSALTQERVASRPFPRCKKHALYMLPAGEGARTEGSTASHCCLTRETSYSVGCCQSAIRVHPEFREHSSSLALPDSPSETSYVLRGMLSKPHTPAT